MNPCPCGYYGDPVKPCTCSPGMVTKYQKRISGPLLDRIDIHIEVPRVEYDKLTDQRLGEPSAVMQRAGGSGARAAAPALRRQRSGRCAAATPTCARPRCASSASWTRPGSSLMKTAMSQLQLSARAYHRVLKLARTIADLAGGEHIAPRTWPRRCNTGRGWICLNSFFIIGTIFEELQVILWSRTWLCKDRRRIPTAHSLPLKGVR